MSNVLMILNEGPYANERSYNGLRLAGSLSKREGNTIRVFLVGEAAVCAKKGQKLPAGFYNIESMLNLAARHGAVVGVCGSCMDARGLKEDELTEGSRRSNLEELTDWTLQADRVLVY